ncbi:hypothetical protein R7W53_03595, partial [Mesomycoplasma ovipneumoniae]|uniref:hypothetical protein n=1 Tax=Mesomycoplasma ovipneumoniae TaxID=29562 RepID=UPI0029650EAF
KLLYEVNYLSKFFKMNMLKKINKSGAIKIIEKKLIVWDFSTYLKKKDNSPTLNLEDLVTNFYY